MSAYIVILNWNGWHETIECLESVFQLRDQDFVVVVCDNASHNGSLAKIAAWARRELPATPTAFLEGSASQEPRQPIPFTELTRREAEAGVTVGTRLVLIDNEANLGFAGGCNVGLRFALKQAGMSYAWLLNNDTVVDPSCLSELRARCERDPKIGICGSQVRYYGRPDIIQTQGGTFNPWLCTTHSLLSGAKAETPPQTVSTPIDYVPGSSMFVPRAYMERIGLMEERYFLYFEEIDWAERGKHAFNFEICPASIVYHHGGASIGDPNESGERGVRSEYYLLRNRLVFAQRFYKSRLMTVYAGFLASIVRRLLQRRWLRAYIAMCALVGRNPT